MKHKLAIVIPFYKLRFFEAALNSIASQTNKNFKVYIGDDGSPENATPLIEKYAGLFELEYRRFENNLGKTDLVAHWNRTVALADEEWIWLFSDDDIMSPNCVETFFNALNETNSRYDLYRFNIEMIDADNTVIHKEANHPPTETGYDFLIRRLKGGCLSAAVEYIFNKKVFYNNNGFENFPLAYCADDASWISFAGNGEIYTMTVGLVQWRASGINISSATGLQNAKIDAMLQFINHILIKYPADRENLLHLSNVWFFQGLNYIGGVLNPYQATKTILKLNRIFSRDKSGVLKRMILYRLNYTRFAGKFNKWLNC